MEREETSLEADIKRVRQMWNDAWMMQITDDEGDAALERIIALAQQSA